MRGRTLSGVLYQSQLAIASHRVFTFRENTLLFTKWSRYFKIESVLYTLL